MHGFIIFFNATKHQNLKCANTLWYLYIVYLESTQHTKGAKLIDVNEAEKQKFTMQMEKKSKQQRGNEGAEWQKVGDTEELMGDDSYYKKNLK